MKPNAIQITVTIFTGLIALIGTIFLCLYALWKIYVDVPLLMVLSNITVAAVSSLTTLLVGRTVAQLTRQDQIDDPPQIQPPLPPPPEPH